MPAPKFTIIPRATLAGVALLIMGCLMLFVTQGRAETVKGRAVAFSLAEVTLKPRARLLVILGNGERIKGKAADVSDGALSVSMGHKIMRLSESEIFQIFEVKGTSRGNGAFTGGLIGAAGALLFGLWTSHLGDVSPFMCFSIVGAISIPLGAIIGAKMVSGEEKKLVYQNLTISLPSDSKTGLINFRDGRLSFDVPSIYLKQNRFEGFREKPFNKRTLIKKIDLVRVDF